MGGINTSNSLQEVVRERELPMELDRLEYRVDTLHVLLDALIGRLGPVSREEPMVAGPTEALGPCSPIASSIHAQAKRLDYALQRIEWAMECLEV